MGHDSFINFIKGEVADGWRLWERGAGNCRWVLITLSQVTISLGVSTADKVDSIDFSAIGMEKVCSTALPRCFP
jgi:hypothetical protein